MLENVATRDWEEAYNNMPVVTKDEIIEEKDEIIFDLIQKNGKLENELIKTQLELVELKRVLGKGVEGCWK